MKEQKLFLKTVGETLKLHGETLALHGNKLIQIYDEMDDIDKLKLVIQQHTLELHEIHLSLTELRGEV